MGFGTLTVHQLQHQGETATVIFTSWTTISHEYRRHGNIQRVGFAEILRQCLMHPLCSICWMMTSSALNAYLLMVHNFHASYPRQGRRLSSRECAFVKQVLDRDGSQWVPDTGVIERDGVSFLREGRVDQGKVDLCDPDIAFHVGANPRQSDGDSLMCLLAFVINGGWAFGVNVGHGLAAARTKG